MAELFIEVPDAEMTQAIFWNLYKAAFLVYGMDDMLPATDLFRVVTRANPQSKLVVVPETDDEPPKYLLRGLERRREAQERIPSNSQEKPPSNPFVTVLNRLLNTVTSTWYLKATLFPLIPICMDEFRTLGIRWPSEPLSGFVSSVIYRFVKEMGVMPTTPLTIEELASLGCGCSYCLSMRVFVASISPSMFLRASGEIRKHLSRTLESRTKDWGFTWTTIKDGIPHALQVCINDRPRSLIQSYDIRRSQNLSFLEHKKHGLTTGKRPWKR